MFYGIVTSESLTNPVVLNELEQVKVMVDAVPTSETPYWHIFVVKVDDKNIDEAVQKVSMVVKQGWYIVFWNDKELRVIMQNKSFDLKREKDWSSPEYKEFQRYAASQGIAPEYLDFNVNFEEYEKLVH